MAQLRNPAARLCLVAALAALLHLAGTWSLPLVDRDEPRFAEASREMAASGDWLIPHFNHAYRFDKPILIYWCQAPCLRWLGDSEFAVRLPSVLSAGLTAALLYGFGRRAAGEGVAAWAAAIFSTAFQTMVHAKMAVADPLLILCMTAAYWAGWELTESAEPDPRPWWRRAWWWAFYGAQGLAFLAKGPVGWAPLLTVLCLWRSRRAMGRRLALLPGFLLMVAIAGVWGAPAVIATHGEFFSVGIGKHVVQRSLGSLEGHGASHWFGYVATLPLYFFTVFPSFFPWSLFLPWLVRAAWRAQPRQWLETYLAAGVFVVFSIFTLVRTKLPHYTLPAFPLLALWMAWRWGIAGQPVQPFRRALAFALAFGLSVSLIVLPLISSWFPSRNLFLAAGPWLKPEMEFASADYQEPSLVWYFRSRVRGWYSPLVAEDLPSFMARPGPRFCILPTADSARLWPAPNPAWRHCRSAGFNLVHGRRVDLTLWLKPE